MNIQIEIGEGLYLKIKNVKYTSGSSGYTSGRPEDCYEAEPPEIDWHEKDVYLESGEYTFPCPKGFAILYYEQLLEEAIKTAEAENENY